MTHRDHFDAIVVGSGPAGCAVAGTLAERSNRTVLLVEAGPDYGPFSDTWPADLLEACDLAATHSWQYDSGDQYPGRLLNFDRARVIGGCSSHNGCAAIWGSRLDYDAWAAAGNDGWSTDDLLPFFRHASERMRVTIPAPDSVTPFHQIFLDGAPGAGIPVVRDLNDLDEHVGIAPSPANVANGVRWNGAFAYLDPVRDRANFTIMGNTLVDRVELEGGRAAGIHVIQDGTPRFIGTDRIVLAGGTYGSPAILLRSGIGDGGSLRGAGIAVRHQLSAVGGNLHDHPNVDLFYSGTPELIKQMETFRANHWMPEEQTIAKARSSLCGEGFDIHIYPAGGPYSGEWVFAVPVACMTPRSRGTLTISSADPEALPRLEHGYLTDLDGHDRRVLIDAVKLAREIVAHSPTRALLGDEIQPGPDIQTDAELAAFIDAHVEHYYHPVGTCKMGPASDSMAVVDPRGKVHGLRGLFVADCSIMPVIPLANTNIPAAVVGERIASFLLSDA